MLRPIPGRILRSTATVEACTGIDVYQNQTYTTYTVKHVHLQPEQKIVKSVMDMVKNVQAYVPGYQLRVPPVVDGNKVTVIVQVEGAGDFLPKYSGNLDIINQAAVAVAERIASKMLKEGK